MIYVFLADGFEEVEALLPVDYMRRCNLNVLTVGITGSQVTGAHSLTVICDIAADEVEMEKAEAIVLPGGTLGAKNLNQSIYVHKAIDYCSENNLYIGAICAAPFILGKKGLLAGKNATCFPEFEKDLTGAEIADTSVCVDGKIITAKGVGVSDEFAFQLIELLKSKDAADNLRKALRWQ